MTREFNVVIERDEDGLASMDIPKFINALLSGLITKQSDQPLLFSCEYAKEQKAHGFVRYTHFQDNYRKYGPAVPHSLIYKKLKPFRTGIERTFALVKENRYRMEMSNCYKGIENVTIHCIEHDIVLTQDIICDYIQTGKLSPVLNLNY